MTRQQCSPEAEQPIHSLSAGSEVNALDVQSPKQSSVTVQEDAAENSTDIEAMIASKIAESKKPDDVGKYVKFWKDVVIQRDKSKKQENEWRAENQAFWFDSVLKILAVLVGLLVMFNFSATLGVFILGIGLYSLAPKFVQSGFKLLRKGGE